MRAALQDAKVLLIQGLKCSTAGGDGAAAFCSARQHSSSAATPAWQAWLPDGLAGAVKSWQRAEREPRQPLRPAALSPARSVPPHIQQPDYVAAGGRRMPAITAESEVHDAQVGPLPSPWGTLGAPQGAR